MQAYRFFGGHACLGKTSTCCMPTAAPTSHGVEVTVSIETQSFLISTYNNELFCYSIYLVNSLNFLTSLFSIFYSSHMNQIKMVYLEAGLPSGCGKLQRTAFAKFFLCLWPTAQPLWFSICLTHGSCGTLPFIWVRK